MPLTPLKSSYERSSQGFEAKLNALVGVGQAIKASQVAKQQMQEQLRIQKDLIQFRGDVQLDNQLEYYDKVTKPANEAEVRQKAQAEQFKLIKDSQEAAQERYVELIDDHSAQYKSLRQWNLYQPVFGVDTDETQMSRAFIGEFDEEGNVQEIGYQAYKEKADRLKAAADWFDRVEEGIEKEWFPESYPTGEEYREGEGGMQVKRLTRSEAADIVQSARRNPEAARANAERFLQGEYDVVSPVTFEGEDPSGSGSRKNTGNIGTYVANVRGFADPQTPSIVKFQYAPEVGFLKGFLGGESETKAATIPINGSLSVGETMERLESVSQDIYGIDLSLIPNNSLRDQIIQGETDGLEDKEKEVAEHIKQLRDEGAEDELDKLFSMYYGMPATIADWRDKHGDYEIYSVPDRDLVVNFFTKDGPETLFGLPDVDVTQNAFLLRQSLSTQ